MTLLDCNRDELEALLKHYERERKEYLYEVEQTESKIKSIKERLTLLDQENNITMQKV